MGKIVIMLIKSYMIMYYLFKTSGTFPNFHRLELIKHSLTQGFFVNVCGSLGYFSHEGVNM